MQTQHAKQHALCAGCEAHYDEEFGFPRLGVAPGTKWQEIPECFKCATCDINQAAFSLLYYGT